MNNLVRVIYSGRQCMIDADCIEMFDFAGSRIGIGSPATTVFRSGSPMRGRVTILIRGHEMDSDIYPKPRPAPVVVTDPIPPIPAKKQRKKKRAERKRRTPIKARRKTRRHTRKIKR